MVARTLLQRRRQLAIFEGVVGGRQEVTEELARAERRRSDLHEPQPGRVRQRAGAAQEQHLAAGGRAFTREASARQVDVRRETFHAGERDEWPATVLSRKSTMGVGPGRPMPSSFDRTVASIVG